MGRMGRAGVIAEHAWSMVQCRRTAFPYSLLAIQGYSLLAWSLFARGAAYGRLSATLGMQLHGQRHQAGHDDDEGIDLDDTKRRNRAVAAALLPTW